MKRQLSLTLALLLTFGLSACSGQGEGAEVKQAGSPENFGNQHAAMNETPERSPISVGFMSICVEGATSGEITAVDPIGTKDVEVTAYAVVDGRTEFGASRSSLSAEGIDTAAHTIATQCGAEEYQGFSKLLVEMERLTPESATTDGFRVHWRANGDEGTFDYLFDISVCAPGDIACSDV